MVNLITEHIDIWTAAQTQKSNGGRGRKSNGNGQRSHGIQKLRELILELAVRGKLVPQDPEDEPASVLLEKITKEKKRLIKEGKIKKQMALSVIGEDEKPFELPEGWEWTKLGYLSTNIHYGYTASANQQINKVRLLRITDIQNDSVNWESVPGCEIDESKIAEYKLENGDILIARTGGTIGKSYLVADINLCSIFASYLIRVKRIGATYSHFIKTYLGSQLYWKQLYENSMGTGQPNVNGNALKNLIIALPPLTEQHRIVTKVNELMTLCDQLEQQQTDSNDTHQTLVETLLATLTKTANPKEFAQAWLRIADHFDTLFTSEPSIDQLKQTLLQLAVMGKLVPQDPDDEPASVLLEKIAKEKKRLIKEGKINIQKPLPEISAVEEPIKLPKNWEWALIDKFCHVQGGIQKQPKRMPKKNHYPYLRVANVQRGHIEVDEMERFELEEGELERWALESGDILVVEGNGSEEEIGRCAIWNGQIENCVYQNHLIRVRPYSRHIELFVSNFLNSPGGIEIMKRLSVTTSGLYNLSVGKIRAIPIPIPPLDEQRRIVAKVDELVVLCDELKARLNAAQTTQIQLADAIVEKTVA